MMNAIVDFFTMFIYGAILGLVYIIGLNAITYFQIIFGKNLLDINYIEKIPVEYEGKKGYIKRKDLSKVAFNFPVNWETTFAFVFDDDTQKVITSNAEFEEVKGVMKKGKTSFFVFHRNDVEYTN